MFIRNRLSASIICLLFCCINSYAQDTQYWTQQSGTRSALLGGAILAENKDNTSIIYNPGSFALLDTGSVSINANICKFENIKMQNQLGQSKSFWNSQFGSLPLLVSGTIKLNNKRMKIGYGFATPVNFNFSGIVRVDGYYQIVADTESPGLEQLIAQESIYSKINETLLSIGLGYKVSKHWGFGISGLFTLRNQDYQKLALTRMYLNAPDTPLVTTNLNQSISYYTVRAAAKIGIMYHGEHVSFGLTFTTPSLNLFGSGTISADVTGTNIKLDGVKRVNVVGDDTQEKLNPNYKSPFSVAGGVNWVLPNYSMLGITVEYHGHENIYDIMRGSTAAFFRPTSLYTALGADDFLRVKGAAKSITNFAVGYEKVLSKNVTFDGSFSTNMTYYDKGLNATIGIKPYVSTWNIYQVVAGGSFRVGRFFLNAGLVYALGIDNYRNEKGVAANISETNFFNGAITIERATYNAVGLIFGFTYNFKNK
ncbi:hypothetical protein ACI6Q2_21260 [Chitinophagaceae bacterium LWZ2-11]